MAKLVFLPIADQISSGTYLLYDGACGTGGMLTVAEETSRQLAFGADPNRAYKAAKTKKLKENGERSETAPPVIRKIHKRGTDADPPRVRFAVTIKWQGRRGGVRLSSRIGSAIVDR